MYAATPNTNTATMLRYQINHITQPVNTTKNLTRIKIFSGLPDQDYQQIESMIRWRKYEPDTEIILYKEKTTDVYFVREGHVRATLFSSSGREVSYQDLLAGDIFGELSALDGLPRAAHVVVIEPSNIGSMSSKDFRQVIHTYPQVSDAITIRLVSVIRALTDRVYRYDALGVKDRVRNEVFNLARQHMTGPNTAVIPSMPKHVEIANRIDTHREAVTRELNTLSKMGLIHQDHRVLTVKNVAKLEALLPES